MLRILNLSLFILFPIAWCAPLLRAGLLPIFGLSEISVLSGVFSLYGDSPMLAVLIIALAMIAPLLKLVAIELMLTDRASNTLKKWVFHLGRFAMADVFLIAIYITVSKGLGFGHIETAWGLYLFTGCILASIAISIAAKSSQE